MVLVDDLAQGIDVANAYAAEHLELHTADAGDVATKITNAGAIFVGTWSPVSLGDYCAGSTHVLPTAGCACHSSGLNVKSFLKAVHVIDYTEAALREVARHVEVFAESEDLPSHGAAVTAPVRSPRATGDRASPVRPELVGEVPYGAPQLDVPYCLNVNENPYPPSDRVAAEIAAAVATAAKTHEPLSRSRRDRVCAADLARLPRSRADRRPGLGGQRQQRGDAARADGLRRPGSQRCCRFAPTYSMYPEYARDTHTSWSTFPRRDDFTIDAGRGGGGHREINGRT